MGVSITVFYAHPHELSRKFSAHGALHDRRMAVKNMTILHREAQFTRI